MTPEAREAVARAIENVMRERYNNPPITDDEWRHLSYHLRLGDEELADAAIATLTPHVEAMVAQERARIAGDLLALEGYRAALAWVGADSWDGCSDCIEVLKLARSSDPDWHLDVNTVASVLKRLRGDHLSERNDMGEQG